MVLVCVASAPPPGALQPQRASKQGLSAFAGCGVLDTELGLRGTVSSCDENCRIDILVSLQSLYASLSYENPWNFLVFEDEQEATLDYPNRQGNWSANSCVRCVQRGELMPSYCCWEGVHCCSEIRATATLLGFASLNGDMVPPNRGGLAGSAAARDSKLISCSPFSVVAMEVRSASVTGPFAAVGAELTLLQRRGLRHLDMSRNFLTGPLPTEFTSWSNLTVVLLGSNSACCCWFGGCGCCTHMVSLWCYIEWWVG